MTTLSLFEHISTVYQNLRGLVEALENETGARICVTVATVEHLDEGFVVLEGVDNIIRKYGVRDLTITRGTDLEGEKVEFRLFGIKFEGYRRNI